MENSGTQNDIGRTYQIVRATGRPFAYTDSRDVAFRAANRIGGKVQRWVMGQWVDIHA